MTSFRTVRTPKKKLGGGGGYCCRLHGHTLIPPPSGCLLVGVRAAAMPGRFRGVEMRPPPKRCGSQLASSRVSTAHHVPVIPIVVTRHISWRVATNSDRGSSVFPFFGGRQSARGGLI